MYPIDLTTLTMYHDLYSEKLGTVWRCGVRGINGLVVDIETGGLEVGKSAVLEVGAIAIVDGVMVHDFHSYVRPEPGAEIDEYCRNLHGNRDFGDAPTASEVLQRFTEYAQIFGRERGKKPTLIGHNFSKFDARFLDALAQQVGVVGLLGDDVFDYHWIDTAPIADCLVRLGIVPESSLGRLAKHYKIGPFAAHTAVGDCWATAQVLPRLMWDMSR